MTGGRAIGLQERASGNEKANSKDVESFEELCGASSRLCVMKKNHVASKPVPSLKERRESQAVEGEKAMAEYLAEQERKRANTERLRQLRLGRA